MNVPISQNKEFAVLYTERNAQVFYAGKGRGPACSPSDLDVLVVYGFLRPTASNRSGRIDTAYVTNEGLKYCAKMAQDIPIDELFKTTTSVIQHQFPDCYRTSVELIDTAARKLMTARDEYTYTEIGHMCRDAVQAFTSMFYDQHCPPHLRQPDLPKNKNITRVRQVLELWKEGLGETRVELLGALTDYYVRVSNFVQKVEHGSEQGKRQLLWDDARVAVLHSQLIMAELVRAEGLRR